MGRRQSQFHPTPNPSRGASYAAVILRFRWQGGGRKAIVARHRGRRTMPDDAQIDLTERVAALEQMLAERTAERDEALE
jgi:hypothetical protein